MIELAPNELATQNLLLRAPRRGDGGPLHDAIEETLAELVPWLPWARPEHVRADTRRYLRAARAAWARRASFEFLIEERRTGRVVGMTSLHRIDWMRRCAGIGYWVRRSAWNRGYATEAADAVLAHAFDALLLHRIEALVALANKSSQRVVEKLGFTREGVAREAEFIDGRFLDHFQYSMLADDGRRAGGGRP